MKPKPNLKTKNLNEEYTKIAKEYAKEIFSHKGVIGVSVGGGIGRGHSDTYSDIDIYIYLEPKTQRQWKKKGPIKEKCHRWKGYKLETYFLDYGKEKLADWVIEDRWERQHHVVLFDKNQKVKKLLKKKCAWRKGEKEGLLDTRTKRALWYIDLPEDFINRGDVAQAHYLINIVIDWTLDIIFLKNNYFIPWAKWKLHYASLMRKKPKGFNENIKEAMKIKSFDKHDVLRRVKILNKILKDLQ